MDKTDFLCSNRRECFGLATRAEILVQIWLARRSYKCGGTGNPVARPQSHRYGVHLQTLQIHRRDIEYIHW